MKNEKPIIRGLAYLNLLHRDIEALKKAGLGDIPTLLKNILKALDTPNLSADGKDRLNHLYGQMKRRKFKESVFLPKGITRAAYKKRLDDYMKSRPPQYTAEDILRRKGYTKPEIDKMLAKLRKQNSYGYLKNNPGNL